MSAPTLAEVWEAAQRIRELVPIAGKTATNAECRDRDRAQRAQLESWGVGYRAINNIGTRIAGENIWHTVFFADGGFAGVWADNPTEAALTCGVWHQREVTDVHPDPRAEIYNTLKAEQHAAELAAAKHARREAHRAEILDGMLF